jgi:two-component system, NarL family, response regulator
MSSKAQAKVLIADDFPVVRAGLRTLIDNEPDLSVVAEADDGCAAVELFQIHKPDVVLMDLRMPGMNGVEATRRIYAAGQGNCPVVMLSSFAGNEAIYKAIEAGAKAYLLKTASPEEILKAIRTVAAGKKYLPASIRECLTARVGAESLTRRELEVLELIIYGMSNAEISRHLHLTEGTVKGHVNRILAKIQVTHRTQAAVAAISRGIFLWTPSEISKNFPKP